ncbi:MAG: type VI secretion system protein TssA [Pseudomonadota bacterium]
MELDPEDLLAGFGDDEPAGPDLEYDPEFSELAIAATPKGEQQVGDNVIEGEDADFSEVLKIGRNLLDRTMDLRVAVYMAEAALNREGFPLFASIMRYIHGTLMMHWDSVHPQLDADDDNDPTERMNALRGLAGSDTVIKQLRRAALCDSRGIGSFGLRHLAVAKGEMAAPSDMDSPPDMAQFSAAVKDTPEETMVAIREGIADALGAAREIEKILDEAAPGQAPDLTPLIDGLKAADAAITDTLGGAPVADPGADEDGAPAAVAVSGGGGGGGAVGGIANTNDVTRALDLIMEYYARHEPSSPVPLLLARAKRLVSADFMTIMNDMAHGGVEQVRVVGGLPPEQEEY